MAHFHLLPLLFAILEASAVVASTSSADAKTSPHSKPHHGPPARVVRMYTAHAILACLAWALIFPLGGILIRLSKRRNAILIHAFMQILGFGIYTAAVGLGLQLSVNPQHWRLNKHVIIGLIIFILFFFQALSGYVHHLLFKKYVSRTKWSYAHLWVGRICITLGIINAGFGFQITGKSWGRWEVVVYTVCAILVWTVFVVAVVVGEVRGKRRRNGDVVEVVGSRAGSSESPDMTVSKMGEVKVEAA